MDDERTGAEALPSLEATAAASPERLAAMDETAIAETAAGAEPVRRADRAAPQLGDRIGRYALIEQIGQGAMGTVYAAYDPDLDRRIALKLLRGRAADEEQQVRLQREAQAMARVSHPNVGHVYEVGRHDQQVFLAMEFIEGATLSRWLELEARSQAEILGVFVAAGRGLAAAHEAGLVHRDFKPDNVLVDASGRPRVLDFGLARAAAEIETASGPTVDEDGGLSGGGSTAMSTDLTRTGALLGTPAFMAAEQFAGLGATALSDQFAFCVALWAALAGERPFAGDTPFALALAVQQGERRSMPASLGVPGPIREALERGLSQLPENRWPNMDALLAALTPAPPRSTRWLGLGLGLVALALLGLIVGLRQPEPPPDPCIGVGGPIDAAWTPTIRSELRAAIEGSGSASGAWVAGGVERALDAYSERWRASATEACTATHHDKSRSARMYSLQQACLDRRLAAFEGLVAGLDHADVEAVEQALSAVERLPSVERCADTEALLQALPPPEDPAVAAQVSELRRRLAAASSAIHLGRYADGEATLEACRTEADSLDYLPIQAEIAAALAEVRVESGRTDEMEADARRAFTLAVEAGDDVTARVAATQLADAIGTWAHRPEQGEAWLGVAQAYLETLPEPRTRDEAELLATAGNLRYIAGDYVASEDAKRRAQQLYEALDAELEAAEMLNDVGVMQSMQRKLDAAQRSLLEARARKVEILGDNHPAIGLIDQNLASVALKAGDRDTAQSLYRAAMANAERNRGREHPSYSVPLISIATIHLRRGEHELAREAALRARSLLEGLDSERFNHARASVVIARAELALAQPDAALEAADMALAVALAALGPDAAVTSSARLVRGEVLLARGELDAAEAALDEALRAASQHPRRRVAGDARFALAKLHQLRGQTTRALELADAALEWLAPLDLAEDPSEAIRAWRLALAPSN